MQSHNFMKTKVTVFAGELMFIDARKVSSGKTIYADMCVIGAGAAGTVLANQFNGKSIKCCILESGGLEYESDTQALNIGRNVGQPYYPLVGTRLRFFGGTTNHWGANCHPFSELTFKGRSWISNSKWPVSRADIDPYYHQAQELLGLPKKSWNVDHWADQAGDIIPGFIKGRLEPYVVQIGPRQQSLFRNLYKTVFERSENIYTYLYANVIKLETDSSRRLIDRAHIACLTGNQFFVKAPIFVLATGGIENARLLLLSNLGNENDLVGRYFMDHIRFNAGTVAPISGLRLGSLSGISRANKTRFQIQYRTSDFFQREKRITQAAIMLSDIPNIRYVNHNSSISIKSLKRIWMDLKSLRVPKHIVSDSLNIINELDEVAKYFYTRARFGDSLPLEAVNFSLRIEPMPNPQSRVILDKDVDALGLRRVKLDWQLSESDKITAKMAIRALAIEAGGSGDGRVNSFLMEDDWDWPLGTTGGHHQIGTTRMSADPKFGVVNENCRLHSVDNLYVAGSSVFPTADLGWPTMTIIAFTLRLAEYLSDQPHAVG